MRHGTRMRIAGVQIISKGDSSGIAAAGLNTQKTPTPAWTTIIASKPKYILTAMTPGTSYLFRVATIGGKGGQSSWSPTVVRVAG